MRFGELQQAGVLEPEPLVSLLQAQQVMFQRGDAHALGAQVGVGALQAAIGLGQAIVEHAFEARLGAAFEPLPTFAVLPLALVQFTFLALTLLPLTFLPFAFMALVVVTVELLALVVVTVVLLAVGAAFEPPLPSFEAVLRAHDVVEQQAGDGHGGGDQRAATQGMQEKVGVHG